MPQDNEVVTKEVTRGQWAETSADKKKRATPVKILTQYNFFESNGAKKPPSGASKHGDLVRRSPTLDTLSISD
jgi:hypothetical protein